MAVTISGTDGIVGAGFTVDASGVSVTAGVGTFSSLNAAASGLTGALPALDAANLTSINAAQLVGVCTSGLTKTGGFGKFLQSVTSVYTTSYANTTATYADTGLSASITISAGSKVLILVTQPLEMKQTATKMRGDIRLMRGSTEIYGNSSHQSIMLENQTSETKYLAHYVNLTFLDTGASTGSNTYKTQIRCHTEGNNARIRTSDNSAPASITLMEVAG